MKNIFANTRPIEFRPNRTDLRNWRFLGMEMEGLGTRLDAARQSLSIAKNDWARWYWTETIDRLMLQWSNLTALHDGQATMTRLSRWKVEYHWWEDSTELGSWDISENLFNKLYRADLDESWHRIRDERLMRCGCR
jgi:hypothetical protein